MQTRWTMMGVLCVLMVAAVIAQGTPGSYDPARSSGQSSSMSSSSMQQQQAVDLARGSSIIGAKVINSQGQDLGKIHDVVLNSQRDQINYAVLAHGGVAGIGEKLIAIPWSEFRVKQTTSERSFTHPLGKRHVTTGTTSMEESSMPQQSAQIAEQSGSEAGMSHRLAWNRDQQCELTLNVSKDQLSRVAGFESNRWPEQASANWQQEEATKIKEQPAMTSEQKTQFETRRLSKIIGTKVDSATPINFREASSSSTSEQTRESRTSEMRSRSTTSRAGTQIGTIKDCVLNSDNGRLIYCVVSLDDVPNHTREYSVVPWEAVRVTTQDNKQIAQLQITSAQNLLAFTFRSNQQPDLANRSYLERVYTAYNVEPQWEALGFVPPSGTRDQMQQQRQERMQQRQYQRQQPGSSSESSTER